MEELDGTNMKLLNFQSTSGKNPTMKQMNGEVISYNRKEKSIKVKFKTNSQLHDNGARICQGGFVSVMLDAACAHAVMLDTKLENAITSLEEKTIFLSGIGLDEEFIVHANIIKVSEATRIAFLEAKLFKYDKKNKDNLILCANYSQTCLLSKVVRRGSSVNDNNKREDEKTKQSKL